MPGILAVLPENTYLCTSFKILRNARMSTMHATVT